MRKIWLNGEFRPEEDAKISIYDSSLMWGDCIFEMMRTFNQSPFKLRDHLYRLYASARFVDIDIPWDKDILEMAHNDLLEVNKPLFTENEEIRSLINVGRGILPIYHDMNSLGWQNSHKGAWVIMTCFPLKWVIPDAKRVYNEGVDVIIPSQRTIPAQYLDPKVKNRSRLHYKMADLEVKRQNPDAWGLLLDDDGFIAEGTGSNFFMVKDGAIYTPEGRNCLRGISRGFVLELAKFHGIRHYECNLDVYDVITADEAFFTNTPYAIVPIRSINGMNFGGKQVTSYFMTEWGRKVGCTFYD